jgi:DNA-binding SARP family transcriptional activator
MTNDGDVPAADALLDALPYGVLALRSDGTVLRANAPARDLLPGLDTDGVSCHDLFSCEAAGGPCERGCFVARAAGLSTPAPEIRIDNAGGTSPGALWVTASPLPDAGGTLLHLRPGWRGDRRRRSEGRWQTGPELRIRALGRTQVEALADSLDTDWLSQRPGQILKYLLCERTRVVMVDEIAESIWPDATKSAIGNARYAIHRLRRKLEPRRAPHEQPAFVVARGSGYTLDRGRIWIDVDEFERAIEEGRTAFARFDRSAAMQHLEHAMELYRGAFLADEPYAHWAGDERNRLAGLAAYALRALTALAGERGDRKDAFRHLQRLAALEPLDNGVHHELVQNLLAQGLSSDAKRRYDNFAHRLRRELGVEPDFDFRALSAQLPGTVGA